MSDGLKYLRKVIDDNEPSLLYQVSEDDFIDGEIAPELTVYNYLLSHVSEYSSLPSTEAVRAETSARLPEAPDDSQYYLHKLISRRIYNAAREVNQDFRSDMANKDVSNLYAIGRRFMDIANDPRLTNSSILDHAGLANTVALAKLSRESGAYDTPTGWSTVDTAMMGGLRSSDFVFIVARTNVGKSNLMLNMAKTAYIAGRKILIISMEMVMADMSLLFMSHMAGINPKYVNPYALGTHTERLLSDVTERLRDEDRVFLHKGGASITPNKVRWLIESMRPDIVYIDSVYLMSPDGKNTSRLDRYSKIALVVDQMLEVVVECGVPIVNTSQLNRQAGKGGVDASLENLGFSDTISTHASLIMAPKKVYVGEGQIEEVKTQREIEVLKSRKGDVKPFKVNYMFSPMDFSEIDCPAEAETSEQELIDRLLETDYD